MHIVRYTMHFIRIGLEKIRNGATFQSDSQTGEQMNYFDGLKFDLFGASKGTQAQTTSRPQFYGLQYIHSGSLYLRSGHSGKTVFTKGPLAFVTAPEAHIEYGSPQGTVRDHFYVCFSGKRVNSFIQKGLLRIEPENTGVKITAPEQFLAEMLELILLLQNDQRHDMAVAKLEYLLLLMNNQDSGSITYDFRRNDIEALARRIIIAPEEAWDFHAEAKKLNISTKHLIRIFQRVNGLPPSRFVLRQRLLKAAEMLIRCHDATVKSIAYECCFEYEFYFSRVFRKYMQVSPSFYRSKQPAAGSSSLPDLR